MVLEWMAPISEIPEKHSDLGVIQAGSNDLPRSIHWATHAQHIEIENGGVLVTRYRLHKSSWSRLMESYIPPTNETWPYPYTEKYNSSVFLLPLQNDDYWCEDWSSDFNNK